MTALMIIQLAVVLVTLWIGARYGSLALGAISGIGLAILVFGFGLKPGTPPTDVIYIIVAAVTCAGVLQAAGGMDWMIQVAERMLRKHPERITILAPFTTFLLTILVGTGHVVYTLMPIICDIALKKGIRPERPCAIASVASQIGITCSPIAAAVVAFVTISATNGFEISNLQVIMVTIPACTIGILCAVAHSWKRGLDLDKDPEFQKRLADPVQREYIYGGGATTLDKRISKESKRSVYIFLGALGVIVLISFFQMSGINIPKNKVPMSILIQIVMICAAAFMIIFCKAEPKKAISGAVWQNGMVAVIAIYGIAWMSDTYFSNYMTQMNELLGGIVSHYPWTIAIAFFLVSVLINSQGAVVVSMLPLAYSLGIPGWVLLGVLPSVYGYFFIPNYPSDIATVNFDRSGTTVIGKYLLNHSFMAPGMIYVVTSTVAGYGISFLCHSIGLF